MACKETQLLSTLTSFFPMTCCSVLKETDSLQEGDFSEDFLQYKFLLMTSYIFWTSVALCICPSTTMKSDGHFLWSRMTQLVPSCIGEGCFLHAYCLNAFRLCETWQQAVTNSNVFLPHLCHHIIQAVAGNPNSDTWCKWLGRSVARSAVQADGAVVETAHSARRLIDNLHLVNQPCSDATISSYGVIRYVYQ